MNSWERLDAELARRRLTWASLAAHLNASKQSVGNWKDRGKVPSKFYSAVDEFLGKPLGWTEFGTEAANIHTSADKAPQPIDPENSVAQALQAIVSQLSPLDSGTRETIANLAHEAMCKPEKTAANMAAINALMRFATGKIETAAFSQTTNAT